MTRLVLDDHLLADLVAGEPGSRLRRLLRTRQPATTNLYYARLCRAVNLARGGVLTTRWVGDRRKLGRGLVVLPPDIEVVPMRELAFRMGELSSLGRLSTLGAEAVAAAERLRGELCVWEGDDGPAIRATAESLGVRYRTVPH